MKKPRETATAKTASMRPRSRVAGFRTLNSKGTIYLPKSAYQDKPVTIGRTRQCDIRLRHHSVSCVHCRIERTSGGAFMIIDDKSKNGVRISERGRHSAYRKRQWHVLEVGHHIQLGQVILVAVDKKGECPITVQTSMEAVEYGMEIYGSKQKLHELLGLPRRLIDRCMKVLRKKRGDR